MPPPEILGIIGAGLVAFGTLCCAISEGIKRRHRRESDRWNFRMRYGK